MKIPKDAKMVFKGEIFEVWQWKQKMFDESYATFEALKRPDTVEVIAVTDNKIIICEQKQPHTDTFFSLPGGRMDEGETPIDAAKRELLEETGMKSDDWEKVQVYSPIIKMEWDIHIFVARNCRKSSEQKLDDGEIIKTKTVDFEEFLKIVDSRGFRDREFANDIFRMKFENKLEDFKKKLFGL